MVTRELIKYRQKHMTVKIIKKNTIHSFSVKQRKVFFIRPTLVFSDRAAALVL